MTVNSTSSSAIVSEKRPDWHPDVLKYLHNGNYEGVASFYENRVENAPEVIENYWYLGLAYLLQGDEEQAQLAWLVSLNNAENQDSDDYLNDLTKILEQESSYQEQIEDYQKAWLIRGHLREIAPNSINNLLHLFCLDVKLGELTVDKFNEWNIIEVLRQRPAVFSENLLLDTLQVILEFPLYDSVLFARECLNLTQASERCQQIIVGSASRFCYDKGYGQYGIDLLQCCLEHHPQNLNLIKELFWFYTHINDSDRALATAQKFAEYSQTLSQKMFGDFYLIRTLMSQSKWTDILALKNSYVARLNEFCQQIKLDSSSLPELSLTLFPQILLYMQDNPREVRYFANKTARLFQNLILENKSIKKDYSNPLIIDRPLKIGYISFTFRNHSVGWLCRSLLKHHNSDRYSTYLYSLNFSKDDYLKKWFKENVTEFRDIGRSVKTIIEQIRADEIDILVDLDSLTFNLTCQVMAQKPAPVQVTWLGNDASGIPAIDYFITDPYVLPSDAEAYYSEKIWRLPNTYLGIDGFEFGTPRLRREDLDIPDNAILYMNFQGPLKRYPETIYLQYEILNEVDNSYLLIKGVGNLQDTKEFYTDLAKQQNFPLEKIRFLERDETEFEHRANLKALADIVLDTYPYNGATTTLETLWCEIPLVTKVGEQFAARNSYTFMTNAGITEGIAWTDEEYVEWGIKLGTDENLRKEIRWKLHQSKKTSPLWNGKQFTYEMEAAYRQMWQQYLVSTDLK